MLNIDSNKIKKTLFKGSKKVVKSATTESMQIVKEGKKISDRSKKKKKVDTTVPRRNLIDIQEFLGPQINFANLNHFEMNDGPDVLYGRSFYLKELPQSNTFASTFEPLFKYEDCNSAVYIRPLKRAAVITDLDNDLTTIEAEQMSSAKNQETNQLRKLSKKYNDVELFISSLEGDDNKAFEVAFVFTLTAKSLEQLDRNCYDFHFKAKDKGVLLNSFYGNQEMAFKLNKPFNQDKVSDKVSTFIVGLKYHLMDVYSLSTIFSHTDTEFYHENGIIIGRNLLTGGPVSYDVKDASHTSQNIFVAGGTGSGKSTFIKMLMRLQNLVEDRKFIVVDAEDIKGQGEFTDVVLDMGGFVYDIGNESKYILNPLDINTEVKFSRANKLYKNTLCLNEKIAFNADMFESFVTRDGEELNNIGRKIVKKHIQQVYSDIGLVDGDPDSLYTMASVMTENGLQTVPKKKVVPTLTDYMISLIRGKIKNTEPLYHVEYLNVIAGLEDYIKALYICEHCGTVSTKEDYDKSTNCSNTSCNKEITKMLGSLNFFDGHTSSELEVNLDNYAAISLDVSRVPAQFLSTAILVALNYVLEQFVKKNSEDPSKANNISVITDEQHKAIHSEANRKVLTSSYRITRKRNTGWVSGTQSISDYTLYTEMKTIITQSDTAFIFNHKSADKESLVKLLDNVNGSDIDFITRAKQGEVFISDKSGNARAKIDLIPMDLEFANTNLDLEKEKENEVR